MNNRRQEWAKSYLGEETWENYESGDFTKKVLHDLKDLKENYSVGDGEYNKRGFRVVDLLSKMTNLLILLPLFL